MSVLRAVIFDVYRTLLDVTPPAEDSARSWETLHRAMLGAAPALSLEELNQSCRSFIAEDHGAAHAAGISYPEVVWPEVMMRALPGLRELSESTRAEFLFRHMQLLRTLEFASGAADFLRLCQARGWVVGIASNAQNYTLRELDEAMKAGGLDSTVFDPALTFWSFQNGFSKPDPHVFRLLTARLAARGISAAETLMVGDRWDNDIEPSRAQGWQTWWLNGSDEGNWKALIAAYADTPPASQITP